MSKTASKTFCRTNVREHAPARGDTVRISRKSADSLKAISVEYRRALDRLAKR